MAGIELLKRLVECILNLEIAMPMAILDPTPGLDAMTDRVADARDHGIAWIFSRCGGTGPTPQVLDLPQKTCS